MKLCTKCNLEKEPFDFAKKSNTKDGLQNKCKSCQSEYLKEHYCNNKNYYKDKAAIRNKEIRITNLQFVINYLKTHACVDCGEKDPLVLEFDHVRDKYKDVSILVRNSTSLDLISKEIEKCEVRCCNCHRRKTAKQFGWYKDIIM